MPSFPFKTIPFVNLILFVLLNCATRVIDGYSINKKAELDKNETLSGSIENAFNTSKERQMESIQVPDFMLDLYKHLSNKKWAPKFDTARSYKPTLIDTPVTDDRSMPDHLSSGAMLSFNISSFVRDESLLLAQLRVYINVTDNSTDDPVKLSIYFLPDDGVPKEFLTEKLLKGNENYWETFDVTKIVHRWIKDKSSFQRIEIRISGYGEHSDGTEFVCFVLNGENEPQILVLSRSSPRSVTVGLPFRRIKRSLGEKLAYSNHSSEQDETLSLGEVHHLIAKRSEDDDEEMEEQSNYIVEELGRVRKGKVKRRKNPCRRESMLVNFAEINYDQWIIAPPSYEAFECKGKCYFPMSAHLTPSKHAIIQTLMHSLKPKEISRPCCVPTKLSPISVLYVDGDGIVTYKYKYEDMVVSECGCR